MQRSTKFESRMYRCLGLIVALLFVLSSFEIRNSKFVNAQTADQLQNKINQRNIDILNLKKEIAEYQKQIEALGSQASTLAAAIKSLDLNRKQLETKISLTQAEIADKNDEIKKLGTEIGDKEDNILEDQKQIRQTFTAIRQMDDATIVEVLLGSRSLAAAWDGMDQLGSLQKGLRDRIQELSSAKQVLETNKSAVEKAKAELLGLNKELGAQKAMVLSNAAEKSALLKQTNQSEATYKALVNKKKTEQAALEQEILNLESQLNILVNPSAIPRSGSGVLSWPLDKITITQYFGNTPFSTNNPQIYGGKGHNGVDFAAPMGTPIKAALSGTVIGMGNTDLYPGCYSFGKWIMLKHASGLSTLYAHLSLQSVNIGDTVNTRQVIGYSGNTGYSTGPHLHFGVYATEGVVIQKFSNSARCRGATIPIADFSAYLNPLSYL